MTSVRLCSFVQQDFKKLVRESWERTEEMDIFCADCGCLTRSSFRRFPVKLPEHYLCFQLKRFAFDYESRLTYRLKTPIPIKLPTTIRFGRTLNEYELTGITLQEGSLHCGHYKA